MKADILLSIETANVGFLNSNVPVKLFLHCIVDSKIDENEQEPEHLLAVLNFTASEFFKTLSFSFKHSSQLLEVSIYHKYSVDAIRSIYA